MNPHGRERETRCLTVGTTSWHVHCKDAPLLERLESLFPDPCWVDDSSTARALYIHLGLPDEEDQQYALTAPGLRANIGATGKGAELWVEGSHLLEPGLEGLFRALAAQRASEEEIIVLHASSVQRKDGVLLFIGPSGCGKTTSAQTFGQAALLDEDLVTLQKEGEEWQRVPWNPLDSSTAEGPTRALALLFPQKEEGFSLAPLTGGDAIQRLLHLPPPALGLPRADQLLERSSRLAEDLPCFIMAWKKGTDLPQLLGKALQDELQRRGDQLR
jgi:hypothetical protein